MNRGYLTRLTDPELHDLLIYRGSVSPALRAVHDAAANELTRRAGGEIPAGWGNEPDQPQIPAEARPLRVPAWSDYSEIAEHLADVFACLQLERTTMSFQTGQLLEAMTDELIEQVAARHDFEESYRERFEEFRALTGATIVRHIPPSAKPKG